MSELGISKKYRTIHSINDKEVQEIIRLFDTIKDPKNFVDFGCHIGHLSIEMAIRYDIDIYAVDIFYAFVDKECERPFLYQETIKKINDGNLDFHDLFLKNVNEAKQHFKGRIIDIRSDIFWEEIGDLEIDMAFVDASHNAKDDWEIHAMAGRIKIGGILSGHDYTGERKNIIKAVDKIAASNSFNGFESKGRMWSMRRIA